MSRIEAKFADLKSKKNPPFVTFLMAGDPTIKDLIPYLKDFQN